MPPRQPRDPYTLGIDIGTAYSAASVFVGGRVEVVQLGVAQAMPTAAYSDGESVIVGDAALIRGAEDPARLDRDYKTYRGNNASSVTGVHDAARVDRLLRRTVSYIYREVGRQRGLRPSAVVVAVPNGWPRERLARFVAAIRAGLPPEVRVEGVSESIAATIAALTTASLTTALAEGSTVAVIDLGASSLGIATIRKTADSLTVVGTQTRDETISTRAIDQLLLNHIEEQLVIDWDALDASSNKGVVALADFRRRVGRAKEVLGDRLPVSIAPDLPGASSVVVTPSEFDSLVRPVVEQASAAVDRHLERAGVEKAALSGVIVVGGGSRLVGLRDAIVVANPSAASLDVHPKFAASQGAAIMGGRRHPVSMSGASLTAGAFEPSVEDAIPPVRPSVEADDHRWLQGARPVAVDLVGTELDGIGAGDLTMTINDPQRMAPLQVTPTAAPRRFSLASISPRVGVAAGLAVLLLGGGAFAMSRGGGGAAASAARPSSSARPTSSTAVPTTTPTVLAARVTAAPDPGVLQAKITGPRVAVVGSPVEFVDASTGTPTGRTWTSEGSSATIAKFVHAFAAAGTATVKLVVERDGKKSEATVDVAVSEPVGPLVPKINGPAITTVGIEVLFQDATDGGPKTRQWLVDGDAAGSEPSLSYTFSKVGRHTVKLLVERDAAKAETELEVETVKAPVAAVRAVIDGPTFARVGSDVTFSDLTQGTITNRTWSIGGSPSGNGRTLIHQFTQTGNYRVTLAVSNGAVSDTATLSVTVEAKPVDSVTVPNVVGSDAATARQLIADARLAVGDVNSVFDENVAVGLVIRSTPSAGSAVAAGDVVSFTVSRGPERISVPDVAGMRQADAISAVSAASLRALVSSQPHSTVPAGSAVGSTPDAGASVLRDSAVTIIISTGPQKIAVPNVTGLTGADGTAVLTSVGLASTVQNVINNSVPAGRIISTNPPAGRQVTVGSSVTVQVSSGPDLLTVPSIAGATEADARSRLSGAGFAATSQLATSTSVAAGLVISSNPTGGASALRGSTVSIIVSSGLPMVVVPPLVGVGSAGAQSQITAVGLVPAVVFQSVPAADPAGVVLSSAPAAGQSVVVGSTVTLTVSVPKKTVPAVVGLTSGDAATAITNAGLAPASSLATSTSVAAGSVISQSPAVGVELAPGSNVAFVVSSGPPTPPINCTGGVGTVTCSSSGANSYAWTIGASSGSGASVTMALAAGTYPVNLTATYTSGSASATSSVTVT